MVSFWGVLECEPPMELSSLNRSSARASSGKVTSRGVGVGIGAQASTNIGEPTTGIRICGNKFKPLQKRKSISWNVAEVEWAFPSAECCKEAEFVVGELMISH